ncbi:MAG: CCA tRNA nucleotidyltransferase [Solirubrobacteraceae bacterium]
MNDPLAPLAQLGTPAWLVGGAVRDRLLGRTTADFDVVVDGPPEPVARAIAEAGAGHAFELSEAFSAWRVVARDRGWQVDVLALDGATIEQDLARRDLTVNAIAQPLAPGDGPDVDPFGGREDLRRRTLRMVGPQTFTRDPLRTLRLARLACELDFGSEPETLRHARAAAPGLRQVAPERVFSELKRVVCAERALTGLALMDQAGATGVVLPELVALAGVEQSRYHHLDVLGHTRAVLAETIALERDPSAVCRSDAELAALRGVLAAPLANELTRGQALRFGALLHDIAKPQTRDVTAQGRVTFIGHDQAGAGLASEILSRLRASVRLCAHVAALARHHLRLGFLVHRMPLDRRAIYDYLHTCAPVSVDVTLLSVADRLATRGDNAQRAIALHLELARQLLTEGLAWAAHPPRPPVRGDELARALGIAPGPVVGGLLAELEAASFSGELSTPEEAIAHARQLIAQRG